MKRVVPMLIAVALFAGCGEDTTGEPALDVGTTPEAETQDRCERVPRFLVRRLDEGFTVDARVTTAAAVRSDDNASLPGFQRSGLYFVAGRLAGGGLDDAVATWAVSGEWLKDGGGMVIGVDGYADEYSELGELIDEAAVGLHTAMDGFAEAKGCVS